MDERIKEDLVARFRAWLDARGEQAEDDGDLEDELEDGADGDSDEQEAQAADLYALFVELAGLRTEVRTESRLVKDALDQFRAVFDRLEADHARLTREADRAREEARGMARTLLRPLLLELLDLRDRLEAALRQPAAREPVPWSRFRLFGGWGWPADTLEAWRDGQKLTLGRLDRILFDRRVVPLDLGGQAFDPRLARAVSTIADPGRPPGIVVEIVRAGFLWEGELLRPAEVVVNRRADDAGNRPSGGGGGGGDNCSGRDNGGNDGGEGRTP